MPDKNVKNMIQALVTSPRKRKSISGGQNDSSDNTASASNVTASSSRTTSTSISTAPDAGPDVTYTRTTHEKVGFEGGVCSDVHFTDSKLRDCLFADCTFEKVKFNHCMLTGVRFHNVVLRNVELEECRFKNVMWADVEKQGEFICGNDFDQNMFGEHQEKDAEEDVGHELDLSNVDLGSALGLPEEEIQADRQAWENYEHRRKMDDEWFGGIPYVDRFKEGLKKDAEEEESDNPELDDLRETVIRNLDDFMLGDASRIHILRWGPRVLPSPIDPSVRPGTLLSTFDRNAYAKSRFTSEELKTTQELEDQATGAHNEDYNMSDAGSESKDGGEKRAKGKGRAEVGLPGLQESKDEEMEDDLYGVSDDESQRKKLSS